MLAKKPLGNGNKKSAPGKKASGIQIEYPAPELEDLLGKVFDEAQGPLKKSLGLKEYRSRRGDFIFHMTDWLGDLKEVNQIYGYPEKCDLKKTTSQMIGILYHVIPHLNAAGRLLLDEVPDPFFPESPRASGNEKEKKEGNGK